jgi:rubrerythrin
MAEYEGTRMSMRLLGTLVRRYQDEGPERIYECRRCSTSVEAETAECPRCGSTSVATYEL